MHRRSIFKWCRSIFNNSDMRLCYLSGISNRFQSLSQSWRQVTYVLLTRSPLSIRRCFVRLACIRHAASVHPEPGSNSPFDLLIMFFAFAFFLILLFEIDVSYSVFKDRNFFRGLLSRATLNIIPFYSTSSQVLFLLFMKFFIWSYVSRPGFPWRSYIIPNHFVLVNTFFWLFSTFFTVSVFFFPLLFLVAVSFLFIVLIIKMDPKNYINKMYL